MNGYGQLAVISLRGVAAPVIVCSSEEGCCLSSLARGWLVLDYITGAVDMYISVRLLNLVHASLCLGPSLPAGLTYMRTHSLVDPGLCIIVVCFCERDYVS